MCVSSGIFEVARFVRASNALADRGICLGICQPSGRPVHDRSYLFDWADTLASQILCKTTTELWPIRNSSRPVNFRLVRTLADRQRCSNIRNPGWPGDLSEYQNLWSTRLFSTLVGSAEALAIQNPPGKRREDAACKWVDRPDIGSALLRSTAGAIAPRGRRAFVCRGGGGGGGRVSL